MSTRVPFSRRYEVDVPADGLIYDSIPDAVRTGIVNALAYYERFEGMSWSMIMQRTCLETDAVPPPLEHGRVYVREDVQSVFRRLAWNRILDASEGLYEYFASNDHEFYAEDIREMVTTAYAIGFATKLNQAFARNHVGYEMRNGQIERVGAVTQSETLEEARGILADPDLAGPSRQFAKAREAFNKRPVPDLENAVKDGVGAVEGLIRILMTDESILLSHALPKLRREKGVPVQLLDVLGKLYAYRGDADGVAHGATGAATEIRLEDAEFALSASASAIVYIARLYGRSVQ